LLTVETKFDRVVVLDTMNVTREYSPGDFRAKISVTDRVKLLCEGKIKFFKGAALVPAVAALKH
jgi:hypothetical protein